MNKNIDENPDREREFEEYRLACGDITDPVLLILRTQLYVEYMLERIIIANLKRGDRVIEKARLTFSQKLILVSSLDYIEDSYITAMKNLNVVRNRCAHERRKEITMADIELIGRPLGKKFTKIRKEKHNSIIDCLKTTLISICGGLGAYTYFTESKNELTSK